MVHDFDIQLGVDGWYISQIITTTVESEWQHVQLSLHDFTDSEVRPKWLQWQRLAPPCYPSAWTFAKRCPARARSSTSPLPLVRTSPSPWTPGARRQAQWPRRKQAPPPSGEMPGGERIISSGSKTLHQWNLLKKWKLFAMRPIMTSVTTKQPLRRGWHSTRGWSIDHPSWHPLVTPTVKLLQRRLGFQVLWLLLLCSTPRLPHPLSGKKIAEIVRLSSRLDTSVGMLKDNGFVVLILKQV